MFHRKELDSQISPAHTSDVKMLMQKCADFKAKLGVAVSKFIRPRLGMGVMNSRLSTYNLGVHSS